MELSEKALDLINELIEINNDRVAGFEKAAKDLDTQDSALTSLFNQLGSESQANAAELTNIAQQHTGEAAEGTSTSGALHRAWLDIKSAFGGSDRESILSECERGEDAIKAAYRDALQPDNELSPELVRILQKQQMGINLGHDRIKSLRDEAEASDDNDDDQYDHQDSTGSNPVLAGDGMAAEASYEGAAGKYGNPGAYAPEPESVEQQEEWQETETTAGRNSKLDEFFVNELKDLLWAEKELVDTLPDMADAATSSELKDAFTNHLSETENHVSRLEQIFGILGMEPDTTKCDAMAGIVDEGDEIISDTEEGTAQRDVGLIFAGQKAEHYEIASYGGMVSLAKTLGYNDIAGILSQTLEEEKNADALLTEIAENHVNYDASIEPAED